MKRFYYIVILLLCLFAEPAYAQNLMEHAKDKQKELEEMKKVEFEKYIAVCKEGTVASYNDYLNLYPKGQYVKDVSARLAEFDAWEKAKATNTIQGYNEYIKGSKYKSFVTDAEAAITSLQADQDWGRASISNSIDTLSAFVNKYPNYPKVDIAKNKLHELRGVEYCKLKLYSKAYLEFLQVGDTDQISLGNKMYYTECMEFVSYSSLESSATEEQLESFLAAFPDSEHRDVVSNKLAIVLADKMIYAFPSVRDKALSYANDDKTKDYVKYKYNELALKEKEERRDERRTRNDENGGTLNVGIEFLDLGGNFPCFVSYDKRNEADWAIVNYNVGLSLRLGNYAWPVQFELGAKPGLFYANVQKGDMENLNSYDKREYSEIYKFNCSLFARLKVNLDSSVDGIKFYFSATGYYNLIEQKYQGYEDKALSGGFGFGMKNLDWTFIYYKQDINTKANSIDKILGFSMAIYL